MALHCNICLQPLLQFIDRKVDKSGVASPVELRLLVTTRCGHLYHSDCLRNKFSRERGQAWTPQKCPLTTCTKMINVPIDTFNINPNESDKNGLKWDESKLREQVRFLEIDNKELLGRCKLFRKEAADRRDLLAKQEIEISKKEELLCVAGKFVAQLQEELYRTVGLLGQQTQASHNAAMQYAAMKGRNNVGPNGDGARGVYEDLRFPTQNQNPYRIEAFNIPPPPGFEGECREQSRPVSFPLPQGQGRPDGLLGISHTFPQLYTPQDNAIGTASWDVKTIYGPKPTALPLNGYSNEPMGSDYNIEPMASDFKNGPIGSGCKNKPMGACNIEPMGSGYKSESTASGFRNEPMATGYKNESQIKEQNQLLQMWQKHNFEIESSINSLLEDAEVADAVLSSKPSREFNKYKEQGFEPKIKEPLFHALYEQNYPRLGMSSRPRPSSPDDRYMSSLLPKRIDDMTNGLQNCSINSTNSKNSADLSRKPDPNSSTSNESSDDDSSTSESETDNDVKIDNKKGENKSGLGKDDWKKNKVPTGATGKSEFRNFSKVYGRFQCKKCKAEWGSAKSMANQPQVCKWCTTPTYAYKQEKVKTPSERLKMMQQKNQKK